MVADINELRSLMGKYGVARNNLFAMYIFPPAVINNPIINDLPILCDSVNLPTLSFVTEEIRHKGYGLMEKRPVHTNFEDISATLIMDGEGHVFRLFEEWQLLINNFTGERGDSSHGVPNEMYNYPADYWGTVEIYLYDITTKVYHMYTLHKAYPVSVGSQQLSWEANDSIMKMAVGFNYRSFTTETIIQRTSDGFAVNRDTGRRIDQQRFDQIRETIHSTSST